MLDTSVLIASTPLPGDYDYAISIVSLAEMHLGVLRATGTPGLSARVRRLAEIEHEFDPIPVDSQVARSYAECAQTALAAGRSPRPRVFVLLIAATARVEGAKLFTLNPDDFRGLEGLVEVISAG